MCRTPKKISLRRAVFDEKLDDLERGHPRSSTHGQKALVAHTRVDQPAVPWVVDAQMLQKLVKLVFLGEFERALEAVGFVFHRREVTRMRRGWEKEGSATSRVKFHAI
tara:strand:+ start:8785 stop:9108 length:324 start_codon:yes stop_codon:yes gene_type:complete